MMAKMASADIMCVGSKAVQEKFTGIIRYKSFLYHLRIPVYLIEEQDTSR